MFFYDRIYVSEGLDINKTNDSRIFVFVAIIICLKRIIGLNHVKAMVFMIFC